MSTRCAFYIRKSTTEHLEEGNRSREVQRETCKQIAETSGYEVVEVYEQVVSGYSLTARRTEFERMLKDIERKRFDVLVAVREDRLGRRISETSKLLDLCEKTGVRIHTTAGIIDPKNRVGTLQYSIMAAIAQNESEMISKRVKANREHIKTKTWTGGTAPFGLIPSPRDSEGIVRLVAHPLESIAVARIASLLMDERKTLGETAKVLNDEGFVTRKGKPWTYKAVQAVVLSPSIAGYATELMPGAPSRSPRWLQPIVGSDGQPVQIHEALVSPDEWSFLKNAAAPRSTRQRKSRRAPFLSGLVYCGACGSKMVSAYSSAKDRIHRRYQCPGYAYQGDAHCKNGISALVLQEFVTTFAQASLKDPEIMEALEARVQATNDTEEVRRLQIQKDRLNNEIEELRNLIVTSSRGGRTMAALAERMNVVEDELDQTEALLTQEQVISHSTLSFMDIVRMFQSFEPSQRRFAVEQIVQRVDIDPSSGAIAGRVRGSATDLARIKVWRIGDESPVSVEPGTPAPLTRFIECKCCRREIERHEFKEHYAVCSSESSELSDSSGD
ncbi:recombinase family protein [Rothia terrae]|uniref:recombinase family protein n=1 Tax=Rothia terrae TaxID=396015 RepID=UPI002882AA56|nr:recombinase family protein [Rothia terrae]MDT0189104.1 recombinase family protein [Rothia terrae]